MLPGLHELLRVIGQIDMESGDDMVSMIPFIFYQHSILQIAGRVDVFSVSRIELMGTENAFFVSGNCSSSMTKLGTISPSSIRKPLIFT